MTNNIQSPSILDLLKKKMRETKESCEKYKNDADDFERKLLHELRDHP